MSDREPIVYVVDDEAAIRDSLKFLLQVEKIRVETFASPEEFLEGYDPVGPCCLVLDVRLPGMSGFELLDTLAADGKTIPVIIVTGHGGPETVDAARQRGVLKCFDKPFHSSELLASIRAALSQQGRDGKG